VFLATLSVLGVVFGRNSSADAGEFGEYALHRQLNDNNDEDQDWSSYSCGELFEHTSTREEECAFAKQCNSGSGLFGSFVFCWHSLSIGTWCLLASPFLLLWMVLLFRMLGSTAEDYFSPSLEMFSVKLGLPPRFAGVSLLAIGNGAADVSATINAISGDPQNGYLLSLGALTGAAMFIGCVVAGFVIMANKGVPCRGALVRDVLAQFITAAVVLANLASGKIGPKDISLFASMYLLFVLIVFFADVYHRAVVLPRLQGQEDQQELERQQIAGQQVSEAHGQVVDEIAQESERGDAVGPLPPTTIAPRRRGIFSRLLTTLSNYDNSPSQSNDGWGIDSSNIESEHPVVLHGANGVLSPPLSPSTDDEDDQNPTNGSTPYLMLDGEGDGMDHACIQPNTHSYPSYNLRAAWHEGISELTLDLRNRWNEIFDDEDTQWWDRFLLICEFPFTVFRKMSVPIPCEGYYCRGTLAASIAFSPIWIAVYMWNEHSTNLFWYNGVPWVFAGLAVSFFIGTLLLRFAPAGTTGVLKLIVATPLALFGFVTAAAWIDFIADHLVQLLQFGGTLLGIPSSIMGLTVLAWGNSMADLSANVTMARKGLANMAMTACFAGPVFNILIGLALGFSTLSAQSGITEHEVELKPSVAAGFVFIMVNTLMIAVLGICIFSGHIPKGYGYLAVGLYLTYLVTSLSLRFMAGKGDAGGGDDDM